MGGSKFWNVELGWLGGNGLATAPVQPGRGWLVDGQE